MELGSLPVWAQQLGGLILTIATAIALTWNERRKPKVGASESSTQVVAATFTERGQMERLTSGLAALEMAVIACTKVTGELVDLMKEEKQRRHDDAVVRQALRDRGIIER